MSEFKLQRRDVLPPFLELADKPAPLAMSPVRTDLARAIQNMQETLGLEKTAYAVKAYADQLMAEWQANLDEAESTR